MSSVDNRIVNMQFNNRGFESGVATTLNSLKKLNESLKMKDASKGLVDVSSSLNKVNTGGLAGLSRAVETVTGRFSTMGIIATTALMNITNKAVDAGLRITKALTIEPVMTGFQEYETKMNSIQTIMANTSHKGTTYDEITKALDELNEYSDKTIYNFAQMTDNIGKFTSAGVDLDKSVASIKGLANVAAMSGVENARAAGVMYQASQAMSKGYFQLMDWRSFSNNGMGNERFRNALIEMSEVMGTGAKAAIEAAGSFDESLSKSKWLTSDVMAETLSVMAGTYDKAALVSKGFSEQQADDLLALAKDAEDAATQIRTVTQLFDTMKEGVQSGWAKSWEYIVGDKEQATKTLTAVSEAFTNILEPIDAARNAALKTWNELGGRDRVIEGLSNVFGSLGKILGSVKDAFAEVFPPITGWNLVQLSNKFKDFTEKLKVSDKTARMIKDTFKGVFQVIKLIGEGFGTVVSVFASGSGAFAAIGNAALTVTSSLGKFFTDIYESIHASRIFENAANTVKKGLDSIERFFHSAGEGIKIFIGTLSKLEFGPILDFIGELAKGMGKELVDIFDGLGKAIGTINFNTLLGALTALAGKDVFKTIKDSITGFGKSLDGFKGIGDSVVGVLNGVRDSLQAYQDNLRAGTLLKIAGAIGVLAAAILVLASIKPAEMENALVAITTLFVELVAALAILVSVCSAKNLKGLFSVSTAMISLASAIGILALAMKSMSGLSWDEIAKGLVGIGGSMLILVAATKLMNTQTSGMLSTAAALVVLAGALLVMTQAVKQMGSLNMETMLQGLLGIGLALAELGLFMKLTKASTMGMGTAAGLLVLAAALLVFQNAVEQFGSMDIPSLVKGLVSVGALLLELAAFVKLTSGASGMLTTSAAMVVMAGAINLMVPAVKGLGSLSWEEIAKGLISMAGSLTIFGVAAATINGIDLAGTAVGVAAMAVAMGLLVGPLTSLGGMSLSEIATGLLAMGSSLVVFALGATAMTGALPGAAATLVMAGALAVLTPQLIALGQLSLGEIGAAMLVLAGTFTVFGVAGLALTPITPVLIGLAAAIALLGAGCAAAGAGVALFATGMATLAGVGAAGGFALAEILRQLISLLPKFAKALGEALVEFAKAIGEGMPALATAMAQCMLGICDAIVMAIPGIIEAGLELLTALCEVLMEGVPRLVEVAVEMVIALAEGLANNMSRFVEAGVQLVVNLLNAIAARIGEIIQAGIDLAVALINGLADGIRNNEGKVKDAIKNLGQALIDAFKSLLGIHSPSTVFNQLGVDTITGLINGIGEKVGEVVDKIKKLVADMISAIKTKVGEFLSAGKELITNVASGVASKVSEVINKVKTMVSNAVAAIKAKVGEFLSAGSQLIQNVINGISSKASQVATQVKNAVTSAKNAVTGMVSQFKSIGTNIIDGLKSGIQSAASRVASAAKSVVQNAINAAKNALKIHSPSRVFMEIGDYTTQGFVLGLENSAHTVDKPAEDLAKRAINGVSNTVSRISDALQGRISTDVVISPVMDLTDVERGTRTINEMLASNSGFSINAEATGMITRSIGSVQNGSSDERIIAALNDLKASMGNTGNTTYQINGITYDDGSNINGAVETLIRAARIERRI